MLIENMMMALSALKANKMRSFLTMLGIIIGIGSVISIVSMGDTMRSIFTGLYQDIGLTQAYLMVDYRADDSRDSDYFTTDELEQIKEVFGDKIAYIDSGASVSPVVSAGREKLKFDLTGIDYNYQNVQPVDILYGRYLNEGDVKGRRPNAVIKASSAMRLFGTADAVGRTFRAEIYGSMQDFTVVGVYDKKMSAFQKMMLGERDDTGYGFIPWTLLTTPGTYFSMCHFFANESMTKPELDRFYDELLSYVAKTKDRDKKDFYMQTAIGQMGEMDTIMANLAAAVGGIAAISLLVGGIGIMNIMLVSVTERTREIGVRKALGAKTRDVMIQFLTESAILSALGGLIGVLLGAGLVTGLGAAFGIPTIVKPVVVLVAVGFSAVVGIFFGLYPASKAAKSDPIDALRYE